MKSRVFGVALAIAVTSIGLAACGSSGTTTVTEAAAEATTDATTPTEGAAEKRIAKIEQETQEAELEAAKAKKEAAQQAARAKKAAAKGARKAAARQAEAQSEAEETSSSEPPNVIGMKLPEAEAELSSAGFHTVAENTDTAFGIVVKSHYTICKETSLGGDNVRVLAQKYGC